MFRRQRNSSRYYPRTSHRSERRAVDPPPRRKRRPVLSKLLFEFFSWFVFLALISAGAVGGVLYLLHTHFDDVVRRHVEGKFRVAYPHHLVTLQSARRLEGEGIELRGLKIAEPDASGALKVVFEIDELLLQCSASLEDLLSANMAPTQLLVRRMKFHAQRAEDGTWNVSRLLPLPRFSQRPLPIVIEDSEGEIQVHGAPSDKPVAVSVYRLCLSPPGLVPGTESTQTWTVDGLLSSAFAQQLAIQGQYDLASGLWHAKGEVRGLKRHASLLTCLPPESDAYAGLCEALDVSVQARFEASNQEVSGAWCRFTVEGELSGRIEDPRLPVPLTDVKGRFRSDGQSLEITEFSAMAGSAMISGDCRLAGFYEDAPCSLRVSARQFPVDRPLVDLLPAEWRSLGDKIAPQGIVDAELSLIFDGRTVKHEADVTCRGVSFAYHKFPYRLGNGEGKILWRNGTLRFQDFVAYAHDSAVSIEGEIENPGPDYTGFVKVQTRQPVRVDERLVAALPDSARRIVNQLQPQGGRVTAVARFERHGGTSPVATRHIQISIEDGAILYALFPYPLSKISGDLVMQDDRWTIEGLEGENDSARVRCTGGWGPDEYGVTQLSLKFDADDVPLEDELQRALRPDAQAVWRSLQPRGTLDEVNVAVQFNQATRQTSIHAMATKRPAAGDVAGRTITLKPTWLPYQFDDVEGTIDFQDGVTRFTGVRAHHGDVLLLLRGEASTTSEGTWRVRVENLEVDRLEVTRELLAALPRRIGGALGRLNLSGPINMNGSLDLEGTRGNTQPVSSQWDLDFYVAGASMNCGIRLDRIHGGLKLAGVNNERGLASRGNLHVDSLLCEGIQCTQVQGPISIDDERLGLGEWITREDPNVKPDNIRARVFGGELLANGEVGLSGDHPFRIETGLFHADLGTISREVSANRPGLSGDTRINLQLAGNSKGKHTLHGAGSVQLTNADIYKLPVMVDMLKLLRIKPPDGTAFTSSDARYRIEGDRIYFDEIVFNGDVIRLDGKGDMTLNRALNMTFYTSLASNHFTDLLQPFKEVGKQVLEIHVAGTVDNPQVTKEPLRSIRENIESIFPVTSPAGPPAMSRLPLPPEVLNGGTPAR